MSAKTTGTIWDLELSVPWRMVLLAMVDHADHNGEHMRASQPFIAWKTGYSSRNVARIIQDMLSAGLLILTDSSMGEENEYRINLSAAQLKPPFRGRKPKRAPVTHDKMSGVKKTTHDKMSGVNDVTPDKMSPPHDKMSPPTHDILAIDSNKYHIERDHESSSPTNKNGAAAPGGGGGDSFFRELRKRTISQVKAREIADRYPDQADRILRLIDQRPDRADPHSLGRVILAILDGVTDAPPAPVQPTAPAPAPAPLPPGMSAAERRAAGARNDYRNRA